MADSPSYFYQTCTTLLERMINTVPKSVTLTDPIQPIAVKPSQLFATINSDGTMTMSGYIRLTGPVTANPNRTVKIHFHSRSGESRSDPGASTVSKSIASAASAHVLYGNPPLTFWWYQFSTVIPITQGVSGFDVEVVDTSSGATNSTMYKNGGQGFPFDDTIVTQPKLSCSETIYNGLMNLTVAIRDDSNLDSLKAIVHVPTPLNSFTPTVGSIPLDFAKVGSIAGSGYTLYNATIVNGATPDDPDNFAHTYMRTYDLIASNSTHTVEREFNMMDGLNACPDPNIF
ncbi:hypothetical protein ACHAPE_003107 [Trichoderma viride]